MALMMGKLYSALRAGNIPDEAAREAAEEIAGYESRFTKIETDLAVLKWMVGSIGGINIALTMAVLGKLLFK